MAYITISLSDIDAVIFDMDGTMIDNAAFHKKAWREYLAQHGISLTDEEFHHKVAGRKNNQILELVFDRKLEPNEIKKYGDEKEALYRKLYRHDIKEVEGLIKLLRALRQKGIRLAIATTANAANREFALNALGLGEEFEYIVGEEHVTHGKPHPEIYLQTASKLGLKPDRCLVFEDSPSGISAAKDAGMTVVGMLTSHTPESLAKADYRVRNFSEVTFT